MIHSARPTVSPVANIVFARTDGRKMCSCVCLMYDYNFKVQTGASRNSILSIKNVTHVSLWICTCTSTSILIY